jgi:cytochrome c
MKLFALSAVAALALLATTAQAADPEKDKAMLDLATKSACLACHDVSAKKIGPAFKDVAKKYRKVKEAQKQLEANIKAGGSGKWGQIPMPAQAQLSAKDTTALASWILSLPDPVEKK